MVEVLRRSLHDSGHVEVDTPLLQRSALREFARAAAAMELLGALAEWHLHGNRTAETEYLIGLGLAGLRDCASVS